MEDSAPADRLQSGAAPVSDEMATSAQQATLHEFRRPAPEPEQEPRVTRQAAVATAPAPVSPPAQKPKRSLRRPILFSLLPLALIVGGYFYVTGGRIMSTDNAYVEADSVAVSPRVSGTVISIAVHDNEVVKAGQELFRLDPASFQTSLDGSEAQLETVRAQIMTLHANYQLAQAQIKQAQSALPFYQAAFNRQQNLLSGGAASQAVFDQAQHDLQTAQQAVIVAQAQAAAALAQLNGDANQPVEKNPFYLQTQSAVDDAQRDLNDTIVKASFDGVVTNVSALQVGSYLKSAQPAFSLVSNTNMWVEASPKETELTYVRPGLPATISVDTYPGVEFKGRVDSISPASGSSFSLLPAQNTTGNWVKVVQRIPMRVAIDPTKNTPPLRVGMSVTVDVDTGHANGLPSFLSGLFGGGRDQSNG